MKIEAEYDKTIDKSIEEIANQSDTQTKKIPSLSEFKNIADVKPKRKLRRLLLSRKRLIIICQGMKLRARIISL